MLKLIFFFLGLIFIHSQQEIQALSLLQPTGDSSTNSRYLTIRPSKNQCYTCVINRCVKDTVTPIRPILPIEPIRPIKPIKPIRPVDPIKPVRPICKPCPKGLICPAVCIPYDD